jgi:hypothetical protein
MRNKGGWGIILPGLSTVSRGPEVRLCGWIYPSQSKCPQGQAEGTGKMASREIWKSTYFVKIYQDKRISTGSGGVVNREKTISLRRPGTISPEQPLPLQICPKKTRPWDFSRNIS